MLTRILCTLLSVASGLFGFAWAVERDPVHTATYVQAGTATLVVQVVLSAIASRGKERLAIASAAASRHLRSEIAATAGGLATLVMLAAACVSGDEGLRLFCLFMAIGLAASAVQFVNFAASTRQQIRSLSGFWTIQLRGAAVRLVCVLILVKMLALSFAGILIANLATTCVITASYRGELTHGVAGFHAMRRVWRHMPALLSLDGALRAIRNFYEQIMMSSVLIAADKLHLVPQDSIGFMYASSGYVSTEYTAARQLFASLELRAFRRQIGAIEIALAFGAGLLAAIAIWQAEAWTSLHHLILPRLPSEGQALILDAVALAGLLYPLTLGFAFLDYLPPQNLRRTAMVLAILPVPVLGLLFGLSRFIDLPTFPFWAAVTPVVIGLSKKYW